MSSEKYLGSGFGKSYLKVLGFKPGPLENNSHSLDEIDFAFFLISQQIKKENNFLCASNRALEMLVNITLVIL